MIIVILSFITLTHCCHGFLLEKTTAKIPQTSAAPVDVHYNELMKLLNDETQARHQLESLVTQLQRELASTKQGLVQKNQNLNSINTTFGKRYETLGNRTVTLTNNYNVLQNDYNSLKLNYDNLEQNYTSLEFRAEQLEQEVFVLRQECANNSRLVLKLQNTTQYLQRNILSTITDLDTLCSNFNTTKEGFAAVITTATETKEKLENTTIELEISQNLTSSLYESLLNQYDRGMELMNKTTILEKRQNVTALKLQSQLDKLSNRAAVTLCAKEGDFPYWSKIAFNEVQTATGIQNIDSMKSTGIFTCERPGLYLISAYVMTDATAGSFRILHNDAAVAAGFFSISSNNVTAMATVMTRLEVKDKVSILSNAHMYVYGGYHSCMNIVQI